MQQCLSELETNREYDTDALLVQLVRLQNVTENIVRLNTKDDMGDSIPGIPRAPLSAYQSAFQTELDKIDQSLSKSLRNNSRPSNPLNCSQYSSNILTSVLKSSSYPTYEQQHSYSTNRLLLLPSYWNISHRLLPLSAPPNRRYSTRSTAPTQRCATGSNTG